MMRILEYREVEAQGQDGKDDEFSVSRARQSRFVPALEGPDLVEDVVLGDRHRKGDARSRKGARVASVDQGIEDAQVRDGAESTYDRELNELAEHLACH